MSPNSSVISGVGINYANKDLESVTKNTVVGNVEIGKSSGDEINKDLSTMTEVTKDKDTRTNVFVESQTIKYALNPEAFKQDLQKAKDEITDMGNVVENTINPKGLDNRNILENLRAQRGGTTLYNVVGSRVEALDKAFKDGIINEEEYKEAVRKVIKGYGKDIGVDFEVVYLDEKTMPKDAKGSTGSAFINKETEKMLIPIDVNKIKDTGSLWGVIAEEVSHIQDGLEGRQDKKVAEDETNKEKGLESLGRPINDYVKNKLGDDNSSDIQLSTDGIDLTNANVGEKVGDYLPKHEIDAAGGVEKVLTPTTNEEIFKVVRLKSNQEVAVEFYQGVTNKSLWSTIYDATPGLGDAKGVIEGLTGEDAITGEKLNMFQRIIGGLPAIGRVADAFVTINKPIKKGADYIVNYFISDASKGISKLDNVNDTAKLATVAEGVGDSSNITKSFVKEIKVVDDTADIAKASKNVEKISDVSKNITDKVEIPKIKPVENIIGTKTGNKELNNAINTRGTEYYLDLRAQKATAPIDFDGHIINGEINARGLAVGGHSTLGGNVKIDAYAAKNPISTNGVRNVVISVYDQSTGKWVQKVNRIGEVQLTTLFPESWSKSRIIVEVDIAYKNKIVTGRYWEGTTPSGVKVRGFLYPNTTVYPLQ